MLRKYFGDRAFYKRVLAIAIPIVIQNGITNFVSLLDNIMVGQVGTLPMGGVSIVNQLIFVFNLAIFGITSGAGIFTAQYFGSSNHTGVRHTFRYKFLACLLMSILCIGLLLGFDDQLIGIFLKGEGSAQDAAMLLQYGKDYLYIMLLGFIPFAISCVYATTLRECGQTFVPMVAGTVAVLVNLVFNYIFIFGHLGFAPMGVQGAAIATVISRFVELGIVMFWTHRNPEKNPFIKTAFRSLYIPASLLKQIAIRGTPLLMNEILWSCSITFMNQCYSTCGLDVVNALNITSTIANLSNVVIFALANTIGILMGQLIGAGVSREELRLENRRLLTLSITGGILFGGLLAAISVVFPAMYNTSDGIRHMATQMILILAVTKPIMSYVICCYYTIRSGGKTWITFIYDSVFMWTVCVPLAFCLSRYTQISILPLYFICQLPDILKAIVGFFMVRSDSWMQRITEN